MPINTNTPVSSNIKKPSGRASIGGGVLAVLALISSAIGSGLVHVHYKVVATGTGNAEKVGTAVGTATSHVISSLIGVPFLVLGIVLALIALLLTALRLGKVKAGGLVASVVWILLCIWALALDTGAFHLLKAK